MRLVAIILALSALLLPGCEQAGDGGEQAPGGDGVRTGNGPAPLGAEGRAIGAVLGAIDAGGPLPYEEDGQTFQNREGLLPAEPLGYYREYTVETPGSSDRGARRLVIGEGGETYYTNDHYASFEKIDPEDYL